MNRRIERLFNWKVCLIFTGLFLIYLFFILPNEAQRSDLITGGLASPDTKFFYSSDFLFDLISDYTHEARRDYVTAKIRFDILWPLVYGIWLTSLLGLITKGIVRLRFLPWLPLIAVIMDYLENVIISIAMLTFPAISWIILYTAPVLTALKWLTLSGSILLSILLSGYLLMNRIRK